MSRRSAPNQAKTEHKLLDAAERVFATHGFDAARLEDIAAKVGMRRPSLLHHFPSKEALYAAVVSRAFEGQREALLAAMGADGGFLDRLDALVGRFFDHLVAHPAPAQLTYRELLAGHGPGAKVLRDRVSPLLDLVEAFVRSSASELPADADPRAAIMDLAASVASWVVAGEARAALYGARGGDLTAARARYVEQARRIISDLAPGRRAHGRQA